MKQTLPAQAEDAWTTIESPLVVWTLYLAGFLFPPLAARLLMNLDWGTGFAPVDLRGAFSDVFVSLLLAGLCVALLHALPHLVTRGLVCLVALAWGLFSYGGYEHVLANDAVIDVSLLYYLADESFLRGSADPRRPLACVLMAVVALTCTGVAVSKFHRHGRRPWPVLVPLLLAGAGVLLWKPSLEASGWRQQNFLEQAPERLARAKAPAPRQGIVPPAVPPGPSTEAAEEAPADGAAVSRPDPPRSRPKTLGVLARNLEGERLAPLPEKPINVLLIFIEGSSGAYLPEVAAFHGVPEKNEMPKLSARARDHGLWATQMVVPQRQTNRGEYAVLCGDYPKLSSAQPKMSDMAIGGDRPCLPQVLRDAGYHTAYLQAAQLSFMMKDRFMAKAGFDEILGHKDFPESYTRSGWGVDDRALFEQVLERLVAYDRLDKPWFAAVLNIGTHHPYPVPDFWPHRNGETSGSRAFLYTDDALDRLLDGLEERGLMDHTLTVVVTDESQGLTGAFHTETLRMLSKNWGPMVAFGPGIEPRRLDGVLLQSDTALSILDYLGLADRAPHFLGRSWFRAGSPRRDVAFANAHLGHQFHLDADGAFLICRENADDCQGYQLDPARLFSPRQERREVGPGELAHLRSIVAATEATGIEAAPVDDVILELVDRDRRVVDLADDLRQSAVAGGQYLELREDQQLHLRLAYSFTGYGGTVGTRVQIRRRLDPLFTILHEPMVPGEKDVLELRFSPKTAVGDLDVHFTADLVEPGGRPRLVVEDATLRIETLEPGAPRPEPGLDVIEHARIGKDRGRRPLPWLELTPRSERIRSHKCLEGGPATFVGRDCPAEALFQGPRAFASRRSTIGAEAVIEAPPGQGVQGRLLVSVRESGYSRDLEPEAFELRPGERKKVSILRQLLRRTQGLNVRLVLDEPADGFRVSDYRMWVEPDEESVRRAGTPPQK